MRDTNRNESKNTNMNTNRNLNTNRNQEPNRLNVSSAARSTPASKSGLAVDIHPLLKDVVPVPQLPKNYNPLKRDAKKAFDSASYNPYLDGSGGRRKHRPLQLNPKGKYVEMGQKLRQELQQQQTQQQKYDDLQKKGLVPNEDIGEHLYRQERPVQTIEWWDAKFVDGDTYETAKLVYDNEEAPITAYIQHPVLVAPLFEKHMPDGKPLYLTKKELKRKRKNERQERFKLQQERIKKGLEPPPPPKVKLSNLMSVLTNEAIKDPTSVEKRVKQEVQQRYAKHMQENEARKLTKEQKHEKQHEQREKDLQKGYYRSVYRIDVLVDPQHFFKVDKTAQQLELRGLCVNTDKMTMVVVEGGSKAIRQYHKLMVSRINWTKSNRPEVDLTSNKVYEVWEGQIKEMTFKKWSVLKPKSAEDVSSVLNRFGIENYWRQCVGITE